MVPCCPFRAEFTSEREDKGVRLGLDFVMFSVLRPLLGSFQIFLSIPTY